MNIEKTKTRLTSVGFYAYVSNFVDDIDEEIKAMENWISIANMEADYTLESAEGGTYLALGICEVFDIVMGSRYIKYGPFKTPMARGYLWKAICRLE